MKKTILIASGLLFTAVHVQAQDSIALMKSKLKITNAYLFPGMAFQHDPIGTLDDFQKLAPKSSLLNQSFAGYTHSPSASFSGDVFLSAAIGITSFNTKKNTYNTSPEIRLGFVYYSQNGMSSDYYRMDRKRCDTLTSSATGQSYYYDSVTYKNYNMNYTTEQLRLDASVIYRTNPEARWSIFGGIGIELGGGINSVTSISYNETTTFESASSTSSAQNPYNSTDVGIHINEQYTNKMGWGGAVYIPFGIDFRVGKKKEFFKRMHLFAEFRPGINYSPIVESGTNFVSAQIKSGWGLRVNF